MGGGGVVWVVHVFRCAYGMFMNINTHATCVNPYLSLQCLSGF